MIQLKALKALAKSYNTNMIIGLKYFIRAHQFVWENNLRKYLIISGLIFLLLFSITITVLLNGIDFLELSVTNFLSTKLKTYINLSLDTIHNGIKGSFWIVKHTIESNKDSIFTSIFLIIGTPYFSIISRKVTEIITKNSNKIQHNWYKELIRGFKISIKNSFKQLGLIILITLLSFVPILSIFTPLLTFIVQAYYNGILMTDYSLERQGYTVKESQEFYSANKSVMFAFGLGFMFILLIPVIGWFLAPTYALVASSLYFSNNINQTELID